jgi:hypothetical protein
MDSWKKLVKVGVWAQVEQHLVLLNACSSTQATVVRLHITLFTSIIHNFYSFHARYQYLTE